MPRLPASHAHGGAYPTQSPPAGNREGRRGDISPCCTISLQQQGGGEQAKPELQTLPGPAATAPPHPQLSHQELAGDLGEGIKEVVYSPPSLLV